MSTVPCTILLKSKDGHALPSNHLITLCKHLFRFGRKTVEMKGDQVVLKLSYTPKSETMERKLGNLPIAYIRLGVESDEELDILKKYMQIYDFDGNETTSVPAGALEDEEEEEKKLAIESSTFKDPKKRKHIKIRKTDENTDEKRKKIKILENRIITPASASPSFTAVYDEDADMYESQKYTIVQN
ncbi:uncharacterized protein LOC115874071 [Sitophilus oryzae]|uniref:Uncharacterized protein LOC115874071 n=1 Tax=Sitophilus oryzae TaxID=7048 RepID=A0A6J2X1B7_SITOR|nr:uncharacterized protein LOC115874071 [Sitophilus oryzae]